MSREDGYYWCKYKGDWQIAEWIVNYWEYHNDYQDAFYDADFDEIDERQIVREKPKMSKEQITKAEELISDTIRKVDKLFGLL